MSKTAESLEIVFRCPKELEGFIPAPTPAGSGLPQWFKDMPSTSGAAEGAQEDTVKRCPPFVDAMTNGFLIPLICDVHVDNGAFTWDANLPTTAVGVARSPIGFHRASQLVGAPLFDADRFLIKFHNLWTIEAPAGWSLLFTHPANRFDLPFTTLSGLVDADRYHDTGINFPAQWRDLGFSGVLPRGTPIAQCFPIRRASWAPKISVFDAEDEVRARELMRDIRQEKGVYRRRFRA